MLAIAAIIVAIWFYKAAISCGSKNVWGWVAGSVVIYYLAGIIWVYWILKPIMGYSFLHPSLMAGVMIELSGIGIAILILFLIKNKFLHQSYK